MESCHKPLLTRLTTRLIDYSAGRCSLLEPTLEIELPHLVVKRLRRLLCDFDVWYPFGCCTVDAKFVGRLFLRRGDVALEARAKFSHVTGASSCQNPRAAAVITSSRRAETLTCVEGCVPLYNFARAII